MALRSGHGKGKGAPHIETVWDELPQPVPALPSVDTGADRGNDGRFKPGNTTASRGGRAKAHKVGLARSLGLTHLETSDAFKPYRKAAAAFRRHHTSELASMAGGVCGAGPSSMIASAALQLAGSRYLFDLASLSNDPTLFKQASDLANASAQNLGKAYEYAVRQAKVRQLAEGPVDPLARFMSPVPGGET